MASRKTIGFIASAVFGAIFIGSIVIIGVIFSEQENSEDEVPAWWQKTVIYHIYVPSFKDSNNDGFGDLKGVQEKVDYIKGLGVDSVWLSPFYKNGNDSMELCPDSKNCNETFQNYDWSDVLDHTSVGERFGNEADLDELFAEMEKQDLKVIIDFIPNHTSDEHDWFVASCANNWANNTYRDFYVWESATVVQEDYTNWRSMGNNEDYSAWECEKCNNTRQGECYLHNFLREMPDLNLRNEDVVDEIKKIMHHWLDKKPVLGFHIGNIDLLIEDQTNYDTIAPDVDSTVTFLEELYDISSHKTLEDGLDRLFLLELVKGEHEFERAEVFRNKTSYTDQIPFSFGNVNWDITETDGEKYMWKAGFDVKKLVSGYLSSVRMANEENESNTPKWPSWEMNNHEQLVEGLQYGRIFDDVHDIVMMMTILLPGTSVVYYGDEIGMTGYLEEFDCKDTKDPYATRYCTNETDKKSCYNSISRDPMRTPMQWTGDDPEMWLKFLDCQDKFNVDTENTFCPTGQKCTRNPLELFKKLTALKQFSSIQEGSIFYPSQDNDIFSFLRKQQDNDHGYLVAMNIGDHVFNDTIPTTIDFSSVWPDIPQRGFLYTMAGRPAPNVNETYQYQRDEHLHMNDIKLYSHQGMIVELDFSPEEKESYWDCQYCSGN